ncbi:MAG: Ig-like domain-containing protein [Betaproteobacteria bacterium]|nr:Ig-like domain-containing protein [Betaproteobacteria bacterium]
MTPRIESSLMSRLIAAMLALLLMVSLTACGGGGGSGAGAQPSGSGGGSSGTDPAAVQVTTSVPSIGSDGRSTATITAIVKDASNRSMANQDVKFATTDTGSVLQVVNARTDLSGTATATLSISDAANRTITVSATTGSLVKTVPVAVTGTQLSLSGPATLVAQAANEFTVSLRNSAGTAIAGAVVAVKSAAGNALSASSVTTDAAGQARFTVTGTVGGSDTLTASAAALNANATLPVTVSGTLLSFLDPSPSQEVPVSTLQSVTVRYLVSGLPQAGQSVSFLATRGTVTPATATTDANGLASATITASTAGISTITAVAGSLSNQQRVEFVSRTPSKITLQASPANIGVNLSSSGTSSSQLIAVVRDAADNPVKGAIVSFAALADPSNGRIEPAVATTDSSGVASVAFFPGANSTGNNQILIRASLPNTAISSQASLTASKQELVVRIGTGNQLEATESTKYAMPWTALVTDSAGNPVEGALVQAQLVGVNFFKGQYFWTGVAWTPSGETVGSAPFQCASEDLNGNLQLDPGEDLNGNGLLDPANVAVTRVLATDSRTDKSGFANLQIEYPREYANWATVRLRVTITAIAGTEVFSQRQITLPVLASDISAQTVAPPGLVSPFGATANCASAN